MALELICLCRAEHLRIRERIHGRMHKAVLKSSLHSWLLHCTLDWHKLHPYPTDHMSLKKGNSSRLTDHPPWLLPHFHSSPLLLFQQDLPFCCEYSDYSLSHTQTLQLHCERAIGNVREVGWSKVPRSCISKPPSRLGSAELFQPSLFIFICTSFPPLTKLQCTYLRSPKNEVTKQKVMLCKDCSRSSLFYLYKIWFWDIP